MRQPNIRNSWNRARTLIWEDELGGERKLEAKGQRDASPGLIRLPVDAILKMVVVPVSPGVDGLVQRKASNMDSDGPEIVESLHGIRPSTTVRAWTLG
jgi:hypothetical protein